MGLIKETEPVFEFLRDLYALLPTAMKLLILGSFGGVVFIAVLRSFRR